MTCIGNLIVCNPVSFLMPKSSSCVMPRILGKKGLGVIADKDQKRRVFMSPLGYSYRLLKGFLTDPIYYHECEDMDVEEVANIRSYLADK